MDYALLEVEQQLQSRNIKLSTQEQDILRTWETRATRSFYVGCAVGGGLTWLATSKVGRFIRLSSFFRQSLTGGAAFVSGMWRFHNCLDSCVDHLLSLEGGHMQQELAKIVVQRYRNDSRRMQLISKHFYPEYVWDDTNVDQLKFLYRPRNFYSQYADYNQSTNDHSAYDLLDGKSSDNTYQSPLRKDGTASSSVKKANTEPGQTHKDLTVNAADDPLDFLCGYTSTYEETSKQDSSAGVQNQGHRRSRRRRRMRHHHQEEESV